MKADTPLYEVVQHLPQPLAEYLMMQEASKQAEVLMLLRMAIQSMEDKGAKLDPLSYQAVVYGMGLLAITAATHDAPSIEEPTG